jgi:iron-sulfur cluster assembly protein
MITITPQAAEQILKSAQEAGLDVACLRLAARLGDQGAIEYGMGFDDMAEDDLQVVARDIKVLISPGSIELLTGATIDYVEINPGELHFIFINPNDPAHKPPGPPR